MSLNETERMLLIHGFLKQINFVFIPFSQRIIDTIYDYSNDFIFVHDQLDIITSKPKCINYNHLVNCFYPNCNSLFFYNLNTKTLYSYGDNRMGQLGLNNSTHRDVLTLQKIDYFDSMVVHLVSRGVCNDSHVLVQTSDNKLFGIGSNQYGQFGSGVFDSHKHRIPIHTNRLKHRLKTIKCGWSHSLFLTYYNGKVYACGWNAQGQCGLGHYQERVCNITQVSKMFNKTVIYIEAGLNSSFGIDTEYKVYAFGSNSHGQLGLNNKLCKAMPVPTKLSWFYDLYLNVVKISCGVLHTVFLTKFHTAYVCGSNYHMQCGKKLHSQLELNIVHEPYPIQLHADFDVVDIECGEYHTTLVGSQGSIVSFGINNYGQCLVSPNKNNQSTARDGVIVQPTQAPTITPIKEIRDTINSHSELRIMSSGNKTFIIEQ